MGDRSGRRVVGVVGGGQLCLLLGEESRRKKLPCDFIAVDPTGDCLARPVLQHHIVGDCKDPRALLQLADEADIVTVECGQPDAAALEGLEKSRKPLYPSAETLRLLREPREFLTSKGLPVAESRPADARDISVVAARSAGGEIRTYPAGENLCQDGLLLTTIVPARIDAAAAAAAEALAIRTLQVFPGAGVFCVEMLVDPKGSVLITGVAPRVHNSGYYTIEACRTSQFEQHVRAITGMPLGETTLLYSAVMMKILGAPGLRGPFVLEGVDSVWSIPGVFVHLYGRKESAPGRELGHVTLIGVNDPSYRDSLLHRAEHVRRMIVQKEAKR
jgi:5-(carboxyamino)imidazole ribonucleotide synthase